MRLTLHLKPFSEYVDLQLLLDVQPLKGETNVLKTRTKCLSHPLEHTSLFLEEDLVV